MNYLLMATLVPVFTLCGSHSLGIEPNAKPTTTFKYMWEALDKKYALFEYKNISWDSVRQVYQSKIKDDMSDEALFDTLASMLNVLRDGHANLQSSFNRSRNWDWFLKYPQNFNRTIQQRNYLKDNYMISGVVEHQFIDSVAYLYIPTFAEQISDETVDYLFSHYKHAKGLIIDIRNNGGGSAKNIFRFAARIVESKTHVYSSWFKTGPSPNDFGNEMKVYAEPSDKTHFSGKVVILTNRASFSASNRFAAVFSLFPNVTIIGDKTGGGGGTPCSVELPNGWTLRFSAMKTLLPNGDNLDDGIMPDIKVDISPEDEAKGTDSIIERALSEIL